MILYLDADGERQHNNGRDDKLDEGELEDEIVVTLMRKSTSQQFLCSPQKNDGQTLKYSRCQIDSQSPPLVSDPILYTEEVLS